MIILAPDYCLLGGRPALGFGPKLEEMNPRTFPDLPICPRTLDFDQKTSKLIRKFPAEKSNNPENPILLLYIAQ